jgi:hypothetical protein
MTDWNTTYPTKRQRLLNELRKFHYEMITPESSANFTEQKAKVIDGINKRLPVRRLNNRMNG